MIFQIDRKNLIRLLITIPYRIIGEVHRQENTLFIISDLELITSGIYGLMIISLDMDPQFEAFILDDACSVKRHACTPNRSPLHTVPDQGAVIGHNVTDHIRDADTVDQFLYT